MIRPLILALLIVLTCCRLSAQQPAQQPASQPAWQPSPGHTQVPIWPGAVPDPQAVPGPESAAPTTNSLVAGRPWLAAVNVTQPTMTVYAPKGMNTGAAVVVFPGGGYYVLAIDLEGTEVCEWLTSKGITCVLLKYRVPNSGMHGEGPGGQRQVKPKAILPRTVSQGNSP